MSSSDVSHDSLLPGESRTNHQSKVGVTVFDVSVAVSPSCTSSSCLPFLVVSTCFSAGQPPVRLRCPVEVLESLCQTALDPDLATLDGLVGGGGVESVSPRSLFGDTLTSCTPAACSQCTVLTGVDLAVVVADQLSVCDQGPSVSTERKSLSCLDEAGLSLLGVWSRATRSAVLSAVVDATTALLFSCE